MLSSHIHSPKNVEPKYRSMKKKGGMKSEDPVAQKILAGKRISIPDEVFKEWGLEEGSLVLVKKQGKGIYVAPAKLIEA